MNWRRGPSDPPVVLRNYLRYATSSCSDGEVIGIELPKPQLPVGVALEGIQAEVQYAGAAPFLVPPSL
jgi:hypothetical protein